MRPKKAAKAIRKFRQTLLGLAVSLILVGFYWAAEQLTTPPLPTSNDPPFLYANQCQDDLQLAFTSAIHQAKRSVLLMIYSLTDSKILQALKEKGDEGVEVKVICDGTASPFAERKLGSRVKITKRFGDGWMHLKILVLDGTQVWIGSANMTNDSLKMYGNLVMAFQSPALGDMILTKAGGIPEKGRGRRLPHQDFVIGGHPVELWFLPDDAQALDRLKSLIASAQKTVRVAMFTWTRMDMAQAVVNAANRGVKVEVVLDHNAGRGCGSKVVKFLKTHGIATYFNQGNGLLHHKFLYIDNHTLVNGSANWTKAAFQDNDDCFVVLGNLSEKHQMQMESLWGIILKESKKQ